MPLNSNAATDMGADYAPQITTDGMGTWIALWTSEDSLGGTIGTDGDILFSRSTDNGGMWTFPAPLNTNAAVDFLSADQAPQVTTNGAGTWIAAWMSENSLNMTVGNDWDIFFARSFDNGGEPDLSRAAQ